jgi:hypothetical protein
MRMPPTRWRQNRVDIGLQRLIAIAKTSGDVAVTAAAIGIAFAHGLVPTAILVLRCMGPTAPTAVSLIGVAIPTAVGAIASAWISVATSISR